jgi:hypothetical protein
MLDHDTNRNTDSTLIRVSARMMREILFDAARLVKTPPCGASNQQQLYDTRWME